MVKSILNGVDFIRMVIISVFFGLVFFSFGAEAVMVNINSEFKADISRPNQNKFTNVTPQSGYCTRPQSDCKIGDFSILLPGIRAEKLFDTNSTDIYNNHVSIAIDGGAKSVILKNKKNGREINASFRWSFFGIKHSEIKTTEQIAIYNAMNGTGLYPSGGCKGRTGNGIHSEYAYQHGWGIPDSKVTCTRKLHDISYSNRIAIDDVSVGYQLAIDDPLSVSSGEYEGYVAYTLGPGQDVDFGADLYSDDEIRIHITALVEHSFFYRFTPGSENVQLSPPDGWNSWINGGMIPQKLSKEVPFTLSSSSGFKVWMECEHNSGAGCGLKNQATAETVPLDVKMTIPGFTSNRQPVRNMLLNTDAAGHTIDLPGQFAMDLRSKLDFVVNRPEVEKMVKAPGSNWKGAVTLIFDSEVE